jgi:NADH-quinone oxidoreductase subunit L
LYLAFFGERRAAAGEQHSAHGTSHAAHLHDAPPAMAIALVVLAIGSLFAGYVGVPHVLGGANRIERFLEPSFVAAGAVEPAAAPEVAGQSSTEMGLMGVSTLVALGGIGVATFFFLRRPAAADRMATSFSGLHTLLARKYFVDEIYDATIVQPIKWISTVTLWRRVDAGLIDGTVNAVGIIVRGWSAVLRRLQTGSVRAYAMSLFLGVVATMGYYLWIHK